MSSPLRVLFTFAGGFGHLAPMLPLAAALRNAGHHTALAGDGRAITETSDFDPLFVYPVEEQLTGDQSTGEFRELGIENVLRRVDSHFVAKLGRRNAEHVAKVIEQWRPHVLVCDEMDFGGMLAAERAAVPRVIVRIIASGALLHPGRLAHSLWRLRENLGFESSSMPDPNLTVVPFPSSFRDPRFPLPPEALTLRRERAGSSACHDAVDWLRAGSEPDRIYVTLGTIFNTESGDLFHRVLDGLASLPARTLVTVGRNIDPVSLSITASNIRIERFVPQDLVLGEVDVTVNHAGSGSVIGALTRGVPVVAIPMGADQELNAGRITELGAGAALNAVTTTPAEIRDTVASVLRSPEARVAAGRIATENENSAPAATAVARIENLGSRVY